MHAGARSDLFDAYLWYLARSDRAAEKFDAEVSNAIQRIAADPEFFPAADERHHYC